jgi:hypothetical protein
LESVALVSADEEAQPVAHTATPKAAGEIGVFCEVPLPEVAGVFRQFLHLQLRTTDSPDGLKLLKVPIIGRAMI